MAKESSKLTCSFRHGHHALLTVSRERAALPFVALKQLLHPFWVSVVRQQVHPSRLQDAGYLEGYLIAAAEPSSRKHKSQSTHARIHTNTPRTVVVTWYPAAVGDVGQYALKFTDRGCHFTQCVEYSSYYYGGP